jgi:hypothetical protein
MNYKAMNYEELTAFTEERIQYYIRDFGEEFGQNCAFATFMFWFSLPLDGNLSPEDRLRLWKLFRNERPFWLSKEEWESLQNEA